MLRSFDEANKYEMTAFKKYSRKVKYEGILCECRIDPKSIPKGKYLYHIRHSDNDWNKPVTIEPGVFVNFFGSFITDKEIIFEDENDKYVMISRVDIDYNNFCEVI